MTSSGRVWREPRPGFRMLRDLEPEEPRRRLPRGWMAWVWEQDEGFSLKPTSISSSSSCSCSNGSGWNWGFRVLGDLGIFLRFFLGLHLREWKAEGILGKGRVDGMEVFLNSV